MEEKEDEKCGGGNEGLKKRPFSFALIILFPFQLSTNGNCKYTGNCCTFRAPYKLVIDELDIPDKMLLINR